MKITCSFNIARPVKTFLSGWLILSVIFFGFSLISSPDEPIATPPQTTAPSKTTPSIPSEPECSDPPIEPAPSDPDVSTEQIQSTPDSTQPQNLPAKPQQEEQIVPVYYNQKDESWKDISYGKDDLGNYGCGPTACAIIISTLTEHKVTPADMAEWSVQNGCYIEGGGSYHILIPLACKSYGLKVTGCTQSDREKILSALKNGALCGVIMGPGHFTQTGHFIVLYGIDENGKILVSDPANRTNCIAWDADIIFSEAKSYAASGGPFWIVEKP